MKQKKGFLAGFISCALLLAMAGTALAAYTKNETLHFNGIKLMVDGEYVNVTDSTGAATEPFIINGTTYLPVGNVAKLVGYDVKWDGSTQTVILNKKGSESSVPTGTVIMDKNGVKVTFMGFAAKEAPLKGSDIKLKIENSSSKNYTVQVRNLSVNGIMADGMFSCNVAAGKTANDAIWVYDMEDKGISAPITEAEFKLHVFNTDAWDDGFDSAVITVK